MEKKELNIKDGLDMALNYVKAASLYNACGRSAVWFSQRYNNGINKNTLYRFSENDVDLLNVARVIVVNKLEDIHLSRLVVRSRFLEQMAAVLEIIKPTYLRDEVLQCNVSYWNNRMKKQSKTDGTYRFNEEEIEKMNNAIHHVAELLNSTVFTV